MDSSFISEMTGVFLDEVEEQLQTMDQEILALEQDGTSEGTIQSLFRAAHTLKGSSAAMGFTEMMQLTHEMEHLLDLVRNGRLRVTDRLIDLLFVCLDHLRLLKEEFAAGAGIVTEIGSLAAELKRFADEMCDESPEPGEAALASIPRGNAEEAPGVQEALEQGLRILDIRVRLVPDCLMKSARALVIGNQLRSFGDVLHTYPGLDDLGEEEAASLDEIQYVLASQADSSQVEEALQHNMDIASVRIEPYSPQPAESKSEDAASDSVMAKPVAKLPAVEAGQRKSQTIRVDVDRLEHLMNLVGELVIDQTRIRQVGSVLRNRYSADENVDELEQISDHVSRVISQLQESVMKARMLPIEQLFNRFPRMIRDIARSLNKDIDLIIEGRETELDRTVIEEIGDPLIHLIRNAVDHGIEPAEERKRRGKSAKGRLKITAAHEENQVVITVEDDGAGIDPDQIKNSALRKGLITKEELGKLTDREAVHLIFVPGFSTASSVSDISGRGVGMDIVRNHIERLNGVIDIETRRGEGTRFTIKLPLTLAIITGLLIKLNERTFILPMSSVVEIVRMPPEEIRTIRGDSVVVIRDQVLPVVWLHDVFKIPRTQQHKRQLPIVVVGTAEKRIALVVDELAGNQEIVVKSLGSYIGKIEGISGATILGDGRVALILEVAGIGKMTSAASSLSR